MLKRKSIKQLRSQQQSKKDLLHILLPLSALASLLVIAWGEYHAIDGIEYIESKAKNLKNPYASNSESNADLEKMKVVKEAMAHAWHGYEQYAWGADELRPDSKQGKFGVLGGMNGFQGMGASIVDAMSTLYIMGFQEEFDRARNWVKANMSFEPANRRGQDISFFETTIRLLGGLVSAHDLSGDELFIQKASDLGERLVNVFNGHRTGILLNEARLPMTNPSTSDRAVLLAEAGSNLIEFSTLAARTGNETYRLKAEEGMRFLHARYPDNPLLGVSVSRTTGTVRDGTKSVGAGTDSYYEYLLKYWILGGRMDDHWRERWVNSTDAAMEELIVRPNNRPWFFAGEKRGNHVNSMITHLGCFYPGSVALGVISGAVEGEKAEKYLNFAEGMMEACYQLYNVTATGLGADQVMVNVQNGDISSTHRPYLQRPEVVESLFYLWRATHNRRYRDWGWRIVTALNKHCKREAGYSGLKDADRVSAYGNSDDMQQSWFFAETLKYLYLLFSDDGVLPLDEWVFNTEAHPVQARKIFEDSWIDWEKVKLYIGGNMTERLKSTYEWLSDAWTDIMAIEMQEQIAK